jgi:hypothetical protein
MPTNDLGMPPHDTFVATRKKAVVYHQGTKLEAFFNEDI